MAHAFSLHNNLKQGDSLLPFIISFSLGYGIRMIKETQLPNVEYWKYKWQWNFLLYWGHLYLQQKLTKCNLRDTILSNSLIFYKYIVDCYSSCTSISLEWKVKSCFLIVYFISWFKNSLNVVLQVPTLTQALLQANLDITHILYIVLLTKMPHVFSNK